MQLAITGLEYSLIYKDEPPFPSPVHPEANDSIQRAYYCYLIQMINF